MLAVINSVLVRLADLVLAPLMGLPPLVSLLVVSVVTAVAMLPVIARTSNQAGIAATKRRIQAALFEIRLFNDDPRAVLRSLGDALRANALYFGLSLVPLLWMGLPLALLIAQLQSFYGYTGLEPGVPALVKMHWQSANETSARAVDPQLHAPAAIRVETPAVQLAASTEVLWRIVPTTPGEYTLGIRVDGVTETKTLHVAGGPARRSPLRSSDLLDQFLYPSEPPFDVSSPIGSIAVDYPEATVDVLGWHVHWLIVYVALSIACAFALARWFGIVL